ncbi:MBL fold metallo-hydrolase [uncultured Robinsoniella sp.]|uniref:MBL fold metallo-hydrolase n=1 Tax=uncultured Robinsoniella sp. TaxID=904190 RepID=UPI00374EB725
MRLKVLIDNNTYIDQYYKGEPAVSYYIEDGDKCILFDTGYSDLFLTNAREMDIDLRKLTHIVFSHGHNDHTRGLEFLVQQYSLQDVKVLAHPDCFKPKRDGREDIGAPFSDEEMKKIVSLNLSNTPVRISDNLTFLGEIPSLNDFENRARIGEQNSGGVWKADTVMDDSALVYQSEKGLFIITGCSHSGICNIMEYSKQVCKDNRILGVLGGFHLFNTDERLEKTIEYFKENQVGKVYPCHCVSFRAKAKMNDFLNVHEVGVGLELFL